MAKKIQNSKPRLWFGLHMCEGIAEYKYPDKDPLRILVLENAIREMDSSFQGCPLFVQHRDEVNVDDFMNEEPDGVVVRSFFNKADGKHWAEFMTFTNEAEERIRQGWVLSNSYQVKDDNTGGEWHGAPYDQEVVNGEYEHLAIVPNPRYKESVILTPDEFKAYNSEKEQDLLRLANSDDEGEIMFSRKTKVDNAKDLEGLCVTLPKSKKEYTLTQLVNAQDEYELKMKEPQMANMDSMIEHGGKKMNLGDFCKEFDGLHNELEELKKKNESAEDEDMDNEEDMAPKEDMKNDSEGEESEDMENEDDKEKKDDKKDDKKSNSSSKGSHMNSLRDAPNNSRKSQRDEAPAVMTNSDRAALGRKRYGSKPA